MKIWPVLKQLVPSTRWRFAGMVTVEAVPKKPVLLDRWENCLGEMWCHFDATSLRPPSVLRCKVAVRIAPGGLLVPYISFDLAPGSEVNSLHIPPCAGFTVEVELSGGQNTIVDIAVWRR